MVALSDGKQLDAFIRCFRSGRCNALQSGPCRGVEPTGRRVRLLSVLTRHGIRPVWLRSPDADKTDYGLLTAHNGGSSKYPTYATKLTDGAGVAFGFDQRICSALTAFLLVALSG